MESPSPMKNQIQMEVSMIYLEQTPKTSSKKSSINSPKKSPNKISGEETKESDHKKINPQKTKNQILKEEPFIRRGFCNKNIC